MPKGARGRLIKQQQPHPDGAWKKKLNPRGLPIVRLASGGRSAQVEVDREVEGRGV